jgi:GNAT superfamily N-acetyltransferase
MQPAEQSSAPAGADSVRITYLEMRSAADLRPAEPADARFRVALLAAPDWRLNRRFYRAVGGAWQWHEKRDWSPAAWRAYAAQPGLRTWVARYGRRQAGYFELLEDNADGVEIAYFGLLPDFIGRGLGGQMLTHALREAWALRPARVWLHTCDRDHPVALANYIARGMRVYRVDQRPAIACARAL